MNGEKNSNTKSLFDSIRPRVWTLNEGQPDPFEPKNLATLHIYTLIKSDCQKSMPHGKLFKESPRTFCLGTIQVLRHQRDG